MQDDASRSIRKLIERMPQWLRVDLSARDAMVRGRAEEALFAMTFWAGYRAMMRPGRPTKVPNGWR